MTDDADMLDDVQTAARVQSGGITLTEWEEGFIESIGERVEEERALTSQQHASLTKIWDRI